jgi:hypothetical protein
VNVTLIPGLHCLGLRLAKEIYAVKPLRDNARVLHGKEQMRTKIQQ